SSSLAMVARRPADHNLKAAGSNPAPATKFLLKISTYLLIAGRKASPSLAMVAPRSQSSP
ncbi:hypothetical protein, partial [Rhizobium leguminosarum]|uniref:hypothetical protein n=1 Tax=Rhizobium leguminosarum TaxID=384 RepID=UPI00197DD46F